MHLLRSDSPISSSPSISPGCEDQTELNAHHHHPMGHISADFKKPSPSHMRHSDFPPIYGNYPYHLMPGASAFHRPMDGKPIPVSRIRGYILSMTLPEIKY